MGLQGEKTAAWFDRARAALVNGVSSQFRYWGDDDTMVIDHGEGGHVIDMDGNRYIDYQLGFGPVILGHGDPDVAKAVAEAAAAGTTFAMTQRREVEAAEKFLAAVPWAEQLRFSNTGTETTMHAIRLARGFTGRDVILKFEGQYHGVHDYVMFSTAGAPPNALGSRYRPIPVQSSSGIPESIRSYIRVLPFNDLEAAEHLFKAQGYQIAGVIVEPMLGNAFGIMPEDGFLEGLRSLCTEYGSVLIFDEVKTGFRMGLGGAGEFFGVDPDLGTFAKAMGNGFPVAAIAGRGEVLNGWAKGGISQAGTYSANGVAVAAAGATITKLATGEPFVQIEKVGSALMDGLAAICADQGVPAHLPGVPGMFGLVFSDEPPRDFRDAANHDEDLYSEVVMAMIGKGVFPVDDALEPWFICAAHTEEDVAKTLQAFEESLKEARG
ncbi:MAG: aspartate aminotransferase family protein [Acidimicrobiia bacterium]|nr:aspartate aminotransferase family protein [Acidimicrobiia bacterium]